MENYAQISREELEEMVEKAKRDLQAKLDQMTPEERAQAEIRAKRMIEEDEAARQKLLNDAAGFTTPQYYEPQREFMEQNLAQQYPWQGARGAYAPAEAQPQPMQNAPLFCPRCGAPAEGGIFCTYCASAL